MLSSISREIKLKFLLDENVKKELLEFLKDISDTIFKPKGLSNGKLADFSRLEKRIFVTNDNDFVNYSKDKIYSVILIKIPQDKPQVLLQEFSKFLKQIDNIRNIEGKLIILYEDRFEMKFLKD